VFVTEVLGQKIYQSYVPRPVMPSLDKVVIAKFYQLDKLICKLTCSSDFDKECVSAIDRSGLDEAHISSILNVALKFEKIGEKQLLKLNALIIKSPDAIYRQTPVWVGAPNPGISWHVGSPASHIKKLMADIIRINDEQRPSSLAIFISLIRLLQVHPFIDGNGRTARLYACCLCKKVFGRSSIPVEVIKALWMREEFDLHSASVEIRDSENWNTYLNYCFNLLEVRLMKNY
jgi:Fic/DOC family